MNDDQEEQTLYDEFAKAQIAFRKAELAWQEYVSKKVAQGAMASIFNPSVTLSFGDNTYCLCSKCGKPNLSIPRMGIFHICSSNEVKSNGG